MHARLLDVGRVSALRAQSIGHALAASMGAEEAPAVVLAAPDGPCLCVGPDADLSASDVAAYGARRIPVVRRRAPAAPELLGPGHLLFHLAVPAARADDLGLPRGRAMRLAHVARAMVAACRALGLAASFREPGDVVAAGQRVGGVCVAEIDVALCFMGALAVEAAGAPDPAAAAEALARAIEAELALELVPSMPSPEELDAIYAWDDRLAGPPAAARDAGASPTLPLQE